MSNTMTTSQGKTTEISPMSVTTTANGDDGFRQTSTSTSRTVTPVRGASAHSVRSTTPTRSFAYQGSDTIYSAGAHYSATQTTQMIGQATARSVSARSSTPIRMSGAGTVVSSTVREGATRVLNERVIESEVRVPRRRIIEEQIEKTIVIPEVVRREEVIEESVTVREKIIEVAKPIYREKIIEVPEYEYVEKIVEVPQTIVQEKIVEVAKIEVHEQITYVPKEVVQEKIVEVPEIEYREYAVERVVEVPETREEVVIKEIPVPRYVEVPVPEYRDVEVVTDVARQIPIAVECVTTCEYSLPQIKPRYEKVPVPIYAPRFIEVAVPVEQMDEQTMMQSESLLQQVTAVCGHAFPSLCEIEKLGESAKNFTPHLETDPEIVQSTWQASALEAHHAGAVMSTGARKVTAAISRSRSNSQVSMRQTSVILA